jgi:hypothetical protein
MAGSRAIPPLARSSRSIAARPTPPLSTACDQPTEDLGQAVKNVVLPLGDPGQVNRKLADELRGGFQPSDRLKTTGP